MNYLVSFLDGLSFLEGYPTFGREIDIDQMNLPILRNYITLVIYNQMCVISLYRWNVCGIFFCHFYFHVWLVLLLFIWICFLELKLKLVNSIVALLFFIWVYGLLEATQGEPDGIVKGNLPVPIDFISTQRLIPLVINCWVVNACEILRKANQTRSSLDALSNVVLVLIEVFIPNRRWSALHDTN